jgi:hypothetical protein
MILSEILTTHSKRKFDKAQQKLLLLTLKQLLATRCQLLWILIEMVQHISSSI